MRTHADLLMYRFVMRVSSRHSQPLPLPQTVDALAVHPPNVGSQQLPDPPAPDFPRRWALCSRNPSSVAGWRVVSIWKGIGAAGPATVERRANPGGQNPRGPLAGIHSAGKLAGETGILPKCPF